MIILKYLLHLCKIKALGNFFNLSFRVNSRISILKQHIVKYILKYIDLEGTDFD